MPPPASLEAVYATDEDVVAIAGADYQVVASRWFKFAGGSDGAFGAGDLWTLTSATVGFAAQGVQANMVVQLTKPGSTAFTPSGDLLAVETVGANSITLRRVGEALGVGQPPAPIGGITGVAFLITSLRRQIEDVTYELNERFSVDPALPGYRGPGDIYDVRVFRRLCIYKALLARYVDLNREKAGDFVEKIKYYSQAFKEALAVTTVRWGPTGQQQAPTTIFSTRLSR